MNSLFYSRLRHLFCLCALLGVGVFANMPVAAAQDSGKAASSPGDVIQKDTTTTTTTQTSVKSDAPKEKLSDQQQQEINSLVDTLKNDPNLSMPGPASKEELEDKAFDQAMKGLFPLTPGQIQEVMKRLNESQKAAAPPPAPEPKAEVKVENLSLDPGVTPPTVYVANGFVTTMTILDASGQPWPIQDVTIGGAFKLPGGAEGGGHIIRIVPDTRYGTGNLSVRLQGLTTPLTFRLQAGADVVYYRYDVRVPQIGPNVKASLIDRGLQTEAGDDSLMVILQGLPPAGSQQLLIEGVDRRTKAWQLNNTIYVRTPLTMLSPTWDASVSSADGTNVYQLAQAPILLLSDNGTMVRARILGPVSDNAHESVVEKKDLRDNVKTLDNDPDAKPRLPLYKPQDQ